MTIVTIISWGVVLGKVYLGIGTLIALIFLTLGVGKIDAAATGAYGFRLLVWPGVILLWPVVLWRWHFLAKQLKKSGECDAQSHAAH